MINTIINTVLKVIKNIVMLLVLKVIKNIVMLPKIIRNNKNAS